MCCGDNICALIKQHIARGRQGKVSVSAEQDLIILGFALDLLNNACPPLTCEQQALIQSLVNKL